MPHTHIHLCKHRWPKHAGPPICLKLPSRSIRSSSLTVNLYTIISSPVLTRHLMLWVAKCLWARTARPLLLLVLCPHACASNIKGQMGEKNCFPEPPLRKGSLLPTGCLKAFIFFLTFYFVLGYSQSWTVLWRPTRPSRTNTQKGCLFHYRGLKCKSRKLRDTWGKRQIWPWGTEWSRAKASRVLPREHTGHSKHRLPTTQEKSLHMDITRWSIQKSDWL